MNNSDQNYVKWFRNAAPYINAHRGKTVVLMFGGEAVSHPNFANIIHDISLLRSLGVKLVVVHGARPQIEDRIFHRVVFRCRFLLANNNSSVITINCRNRCFNALPNGIGFHSLCDSGMLKKIQFTAPIYQYFAFALSQFEFS